MRVSPSCTKPGAKVTIIAEAANAGRRASTYSLALKVNGKAEAVKRLTLGVGQSQKVVFTVFRDKPGVYEVALDGVKGSFTIAMQESPVPFMQSYSNPANRCQQAGTSRTRQSKHSTTRYGVEAISVQTGWQLGRLRGIE